MSSQNYYPILQAVQSRINALALTDWNNNPLPNAIRKLPKVDETIDALPLLCIALDDKPPKRQVITFGPVYRVTYPVQVVWVADGNRDYTSNLSAYTNWEYQISNAFQTPAGLKASVASVWDVNVIPSLVLDRSEINDNYDYGGLTVEVVTTES